MALNVYQPPDPAAGAEISVAVPGQYVYDLFELAATLTTTNTVSFIANDATGNGNAGGYETGRPPVKTAPWAPDLVPGLVAGDDAVRFGTQPSTFEGIVFIPGGLISPVAPFTIEGWAQFAAGANVGGVLFNCYTATPADEVAFVIVAPHVFGSLKFAPVSGAAWSVDTPAFTYPDDGAAHYVVLTYDGVTFQFYLDGAAVTTTLTGVFPVAWPALTFSGIAQTSGDAAALGTFDEVAIYPAALAGADVAAHFAAASVSFGTYAAAVLFAAPTAYYHLDDIAPPAPVTPALLLSDGTHTVGAFPADVTLFGPGSRTYRWVVGTNSLVPAGVAGDVLAQLGSFTLPAGYVMRTVTAGLTSAGQWSDVQLWVDQRANVDGGGLLPFDYQNVLILG